MIASYKLKLRIDFRERFRIRESKVPLFHVENGVVSVHRMGRGAGRRSLQNSIYMDDLIVSEVQKFMQDYTNAKGCYKGIIYLIFKL